MHVPGIYYSQEIVTNQNTAVFRLILKKSSCKTSHKIWSILSFIFKHRKWVSVIFLLSEALLPLMELWLLWKVTLTAQSQRNMENLNRTSFNTNTNKFKNYFNKYSLHCSGKNKIFCKCTPDYRKRKYSSNNYRVYRIFQQKLPQLAANIFSVLYRLLSKTFI